MKIILVLGLVSASAALAQNAAPTVPLSTSRPGKGMLIAGSIASGLGLASLIGGIAAASIPQFSCGGWQPINFVGFAGTLLAAVGAWAVVGGIVLVLAGGSKLRNPRTEALARPSPEARLSPPAPKPLPSVGPLVQVAAF